MASPASHAYTDAQARLVASSLALGDDESRLAPFERMGCRRFTSGADRLLNFLSSGGMGAVAKSVNGYLIDTFVFLTWLPPFGWDGSKLLLAPMPPLGTCCQPSPTLSQSWQEKEKDLRVEPTSSSCPPLFLHFSS